MIILRIQSMLCSVFGAVEPLIRMCWGDNIIIARGLSDQKPHFRLMWMRSICALDSIISIFKKRMMSI